MAKFINIGLASIFLLGAGGNCFSQERNFAPYVGASIDIGSNNGPGWGVEAGTRIYLFYAGFEYGIYGYNFTVNTNDPNPDSPGPDLPTPAPGDPESFLGIDAGYFLINNDEAGPKLCVGLVVLSSYQVWNDSFDTITNKWNTFIRNYINVGPDLRLVGEHFCLTAAYTARRGYKLGLGYMF